MGPAALAARSLLVVVCLVVAAEASAGVAGPLGVQHCNTRCQTRFTDCMQRCDGAPPCERSCRKRVDGCVDACSKKHE